jgi:hypothetical protein
MLTTVFALTGDTKEEIDDNRRAISLNVRLIRILDPKRHISLIVKSLGDLESDVIAFDKVYENKTENNDINFVANSLLRIEGDQILYMSPRIFSLSPLSRAFERNMPDGVFLPADVLDFRCNVLDADEIWRKQQMFSKHQWPVVTPRLMLFNNDAKSKEFLMALEKFSLDWSNIGTEISDGAMSELTWDNLISFTCHTHDANYRTSDCLDFRSFARRDFAKDKNWINKDWNEWLDAWWVIKDAYYLRVENFRQHGFVELTGDCLNDISTWIEKIKND